MKTPPKKHWKLNCSNTRNNVLSSHSFLKSKAHVFTLPGSRYSTMHTKPGLSHWFVGPPEVWQDPAHSHENKYFDQHAQKKVWEAIWCEVNITELISFFSLHFFAARWDSTPEHTHVPVSRRNDTPVSADEPKFALPMLLCVWVISLWTPATSSKRSESSKKGQRKKKHKRKEKERREPCFPNHNAHWGFSCGGEGEVNNFVYHGFFFPLLFHFTASLFQAFLFSGAAEKAGWLMQIPSLFTFQSHPFLFREGSPLVINSQQN